MNEECRRDLQKMDKEILQQMKQKRREILANISDLPPSKKETVIKNLDELIILASKSV
ncbi:hypothetical protein [Lederbergia ruris]|uniref:Uncharacterized protein n=1 Tax=Lederbergia ruris TaxID=217495 RepID=A0ABQ4KH77_9BACI|nr:hypothetical protein [Lederbergia ruris]GIN57320.1 hypothetical protein J8TS2_16390 [Lederbergia ruris]